MGLRFRKSVKIGNSRITVSKSGISASTGVKGARITKTASGRTRTTLSVPGTGVSYSKTLSSSSNLHDFGNSISMATAGIIIRWLVTVFIAGLGVVFFPSVATLLFGVAALLVVPVNKVQQFTGAFLKPWMKVLLVVLLVLVALFMAAIQ